MEAATEESFTLQRLGYEPLPYFSDGDGDSDSVLKYKFLERFRFVVEPLADMKLHALSSSSYDYYKFKVCSVAGERLLPLRLRLRQCVMVMVMVTVLVMSVCVCVRRRVLRGRRVVPGGRVFVLRLQRGQLRLPSAAVPVLADGGAALSRPLRRRRRRHRLRGHRSAARADPT